MRVQDCQWTSLIGTVSDEADGIEPRGFTDLVLQFLNEISWLKFPMSQWNMKACDLGNSLIKTRLSYWQKEMQCSIKNTGSEHFLDQTELVGVHDWSKESRRRDLTTTFGCTFASKLSLCLQAPLQRRATKKLVYRLIQLFSSTEIFSKRRKICTGWRKTRVNEVSGCLDDSLWLGAVTQVG